MPDPPRTMTSESAASATSAKDSMAATVDLSRLPRDLHETRTGIHEMTGRMQKAYAAVFLPPGDATGR